SDDEIRQWLSGGLLLDGIAASILVERGFGDLLGVRSGRLVTQEEIPYSIEQCVDADFSLRVGAQMSLDHADYASALFQGELLEGARVASDLRRPTQEVVGHGLTLFANALGGRVAIVPWRADSRLLMNLRRATQLTKTLAYLDPDNTH